MNKNLHIPQGYRQTEVGVIPDDWEVVRFDNLRDKNVNHSITGGPFGSNLKSEHYTKAGVRIIQLQNIGDGLFINKNFIYTDENKAKELKSCLIYPNDIILAKMAEPLARACIIPDFDPKFLMGSDGIRLHIDANKYNNKFILESINYKKFRNIAIKRSTGSTRQRIGLNDLKSIPIIIPPLKEQQKIADILTTWDNAIKQQTRLCEKKQQLKKGLMQQLLTAKTRFSEFSDDWKIEKLKNVFNFKKGSGLSKGKIVSSGDFDCVLYGELYTIYNEIITTIKSKTNAKEGFSSQYDDILIPASTTTSAIDLAIASVIKKDNVLLGGDINILRNIYNNICGDFFSHYLTYIKKNEIAKYAQGITIIHLYAKDFGKIEVHLPSVKEQQKIAQVLILADNEITKLQTELALLKTQKKGLMQQLLTGKIRIKIQENEMGRKVFVSYKHGDNSVQGGTARDYVDYLSENTLKNDVYKGEYNEDLSAFKDDTIKNRLKDKIHDSSVTLVLISPNMKDSYKNESDQWIPWEISYSLKEIMRNDKTSHTNGVLGVVLPDMYGNYDYFFKEDICRFCNSYEVQADKLFQILKNNMLNAKKLTFSNCLYCDSYAEGRRSYIEYVKWHYFISNKDYYLNRTVSIRDDRKSYNITKEV